MVKDNYSIAQTKKSQKNRNAVVLVILLMLATYIPQNLIASIFISKLGQVSDSLYGDRLILTMLYSTILISILVYLIARYYLNRNAESLGLKSPNRFWAYIKGAIIGLGMITGTFLLAKAFGIADTKLNLENINPLVFLAFFIGWIFQGFEEEFLCRSVLMNYFAATNRLVSAIVSNSLIFAIMHMGNSGFGLLPFLNIFLMGLIFSLLFFISDDIFLPAAAHSFWNFAQANIYGINVSGISKSTTSIIQTKLAGSPFLTGGDFGIEGGLMTFIVEVLVVLILIYWIRVKREYRPAYKNSPA